MKRSMRLTTAILSIASTLAAAAPGRAPTLLDVQLERAGNSEVKAVITNKGNTSLKLFKTGSILDSCDVEKVTVTSNEHREVPFDGIRLRVATDHLDESAFQTLAAGQSITVTFDVAQSHNLSAGGTYTFLASGALSFAQEGSNQLTGSVPYESNPLQAKVDGSAAEGARVAHRQKKKKKRSSVQSDCSGNRWSVTQTALRNCASMAQRAQEAAAHGPADKLHEYFKSSSNYVRDTVSGVFGRVASECSTTNGGVSRYYCSDVLRSCKSGVLAYTSPSDNMMVYCDLYFQVLPAVTQTCHYQDQATTNIHETTHLWQIKGTADYGGYGYRYSQSLSAEQNLNHADTYALFANAVYLGC